MNTPLINSTPELLQVLSDYVKEMNSDNSSNFKSIIFKKYSDKYNDRNGPFLRLIKLVNNSLLPFRVTSKNVLKFKSSKSLNKVEGEKYSDTQKLGLFKLLEGLNESKITGHIALKSIIDFIKIHSKHETLILNIIDKDLKTRFTAKNINKVMNGFVPLFEVSLGLSYKNCKKELEKPYKNGWYISRKLDGVRCITIIRFDENENQENKPTITFYSRQGKTFLTLNKLQIDIDKKMLAILASQKKENSVGFVLDGEVCKIDSSGVEDFQGVMKEINKKNHIMNNPKYILFDMLTIEEFESCVSTRLLSERYTQLMSVMNQSKCARLSYIEQLPYTEPVFGTMQEKVKDNNWEGLMLRKNDKYQGKRSKDILKVKDFHREEYNVQDVEFSKMRVINENSKLEEEIDVLKAVKICHKGYSVSVGSGFNLKERKKFYIYPEKIKGKIISVQFFEETTDSDGNLSLRFPTFQGIYGDKREF